MVERYASPSLAREEAGRICCTQRAAEDKYAHKLLAQQGGTLNVQGPPERDAQQTLDSLQAPPIMGWQNWGQIWQRQRNWCDLRLYGTCQHPLTMRKNSLHQDIFEKIQNMGIHHQVHRRDPDHLREDRNSDVTTTAQSDRS